MIDEAKEVKVYTVFVVKRLTHMVAYRQAFLLFIFIKYDRKTVKNTKQTNPIKEYLNK
ncbi:MAG TPA: hypothetical protein GXZ37_03825 [Clostridiales bacterium]|nr:hypothetical protein [Clostridiales bacterium]